MADLSAFPITRKWPARDPDRIQLYSLPTPNGVKASVMLEETGLPYEPHRVDFETRDQLSPEFLSLNPYGKIPAANAREKRFVQIGQATHIALLERNRMQLYREVQAFLDE